MIAYVNLYYAGDANLFYVNRAYVSCERAEGQLRGVSKPITHVYIYIYIYIYTCKYLGQERTDFKNLK